MRRSSTTNHIGEAMGMPSRRSDVKMPVWLASTIAHASSEESRTLIGLPAARVWLPARSGAVRRPGRERSTRLGDPSRSALHQRGVGALGEGLRVVADAEPDATTTRERVTAESLDERGIVERVRHQHPLDVEVGGDLLQVEVERLLRRERPDGPGAREEYLQEQRRAELRSEEHTSELQS